ncbi:hypothetical protein [Siphonobacter curvatus]|uniref:Uncharacterized protein n=1 Tax=Siphonobacter curvatus TaxID=2094562 RepID=A0A2S7IQ42_9BACT|nr:hypothetical protein [Siphonobacter curvatus]PQA59837.1 hypothetical protein C5O19_09505 [Siphonobacter curvatus]
MKRLLPIGIIVSGILLALNLKFCSCESYEQEIKDLRRENEKLQARNKLLADSLPSTLLLLEQPNGPGMTLEE